MPNIDSEKNYINLGAGLLNFWKVIEATAAEGNGELNELIAELKNISICPTENPIHTDTLIKLFNTAVSNMNSPKRSLNRLNKILIEVNPYIHWYPNNIYEHQGDAEKSDNYCANIVGKKRESQGNPFLFYNDKILVGLFLLGPNKLYPEHFHPASEMWVILSGRARWKRGEEEWKIRKPGEYFFHSSNKTHAMETMDEPLLAIWAWTGDLGQWAKWKD